MCTLQAVMPLGEVPAAEVKHVTGAAGGVPRTASPLPKLVNAPSVAAFEALDEASAPGEDEAVAEAIDAAHTSMLVSPLSSRCNSVVDLSMKPAASAAALSAALGSLADSTKGCTVHEEGHCCPRIPAAAHACTTLAEESELFQEHEVEPCSICLSSDTDSRWVQLRRCGHRFHFSCVDEWKKQYNSCPLCRTWIISNFAIDNIAGVPAEADESKLISKLLSPPVRTRGLLRRWLGRPEESKWGSIKLTERGLCFVPTSKNSRLTEVRQSSAICERPSSTAKTGGAPTFVLPFLAVKRVFTIDDVVCIAVRRNKGVHGDLMYYGLHFEKPHLASVCFSAVKSLCKKAVETRRNRNRSLSVSARLGGRTIGRRNSLASLASLAPPQAPASAATSASAASTSGGTTGSLALTTSPFGRTRSSTLRIARPASWMSGLEGDASA